jgi:hypothetical protein
VALLSWKRSLELFNCASGCVVAVCNSSGLFVFDNFYSLRGIMWMPSSNLRDYLVMAFSVAMIN